MTGSLPGPVNELKTNELYTRVPEWQPWRLCSFETKQDPFCFALLFTTITALILTGVAFAFSIGGTRSFRLPFHGIVTRTALGRSGIRPVVSHTSLVNNKTARSIGHAVVNPVRLASAGFEDAVGNGARHGTAVGL